MHADYKPLQIRVRLDKTKIGSCSQPRDLQLSNRVNLSRIVHSEANEYLLK